MDPHRMEKVDLIPLEWVAISDRPSVWRNGGVMMWCRRCKAQLGENATKVDAASLTELVKIADVHQTFHCPNPDKLPEWRPQDHREHQNLRIKFAKELEGIIEERVSEALSAHKSGLRV